MKNTINYKFKKPEGTDLINIDDLNYNFDIIDNNLKIANDKNTITGNSGSSSKLQTARKINGIDFDGTKDIIITDNTKLPTTGGKMSGDLHFDIKKNGQSNGLVWDGLTDAHRIFVEEYKGEEATRLVIFNEDNGDTDYTTFRSNSSGNGAGSYKDIFEIHSSYVKSNSPFIVESGNGQISAKRGNNLAILSSSTTDGEYLFGGKNADDNSDFIKHYIRIGSNKLQYTSNGNTKNIILDNDPRLTNSRPANGGNSDTLDGKHADDFLLKESIRIDNKDLNELRTPGIYALADCKNSIYKYCYCIVIKWNSNNDVCQILIPNTSLDIITSNMRIGTHDGKWSPWKEFSFQGHKHSKSEITDMPTKVSQFANDIGFITAKDVDTSKNHIHANKTIIDAINQTNINNWNNSFNHIGDNVKHITNNERNLWNSVNNKSDKNHNHEDRLYLRKTNGKDTNIDNLTNKDTLFVNTGGTIEGTLPLNGDNSHAILHLNTHDGNYNTQLDFNTSTNNLYIRSRHGSGTWGPWETFYNTGHKPNKEDVGLNNVDNVKDIDKPISKLVQVALNSKSNTGHKHSKSEITDMPNSLPANGGNSDTVDGLHSSAFFRRDTSNDVDIRLASCDGRGLKFWDSDDFKISMSSVGNNTFGGRMAGETSSDYNMYFKMSGGSNRGFVFKNNTNIIAGIDGNGNIRTKGDIALGNNKAQIKYNSSTESIDFVFE